MPSLWRSAATILAGLAIVACSGGGDDGGSDTAPPTIDRFGIWFGTEANSGRDVIAITSSAGISAGPLLNLFFEPAPTEHCTAGFRINSTTGAVLGECALRPAFGATLAGGGTSGKCTATGGTMQERRSFDMTMDCETYLNFRADLIGATYSYSISMTYSDLWERNSNLAEIAGTYGVGNEVLSIDSNGVVFGQDSGSGCVTNGQITEGMSANRNIYAVQVFLANCTGADANKNSPPGDAVGHYGVAFLNNSVSPEELTIVTDGASFDRRPYNFIYTLQRL